MSGTREPPQESRRPAGGALLLLVVAILGGVAAVPCARAEPGEHYRLIVAATREKVKQNVSQGVRATFHRDMAQIASKRTLAILAAGGALAGVCALVEDPAPGADAREGHWWDASSDVGNTAGNVATIGAVTGTGLLVGHLSGSESVSLTGSALAHSVIYSAGITLPLKAA